MSKVVNTVGIVIKENVVSDNDKMLTILTADYGRISVRARGCRKASSSLLSSTQFLAFCNFTLYKTNTGYILNEAKSIELFYEIYIDYDKLILATELSKTIFTVSREEVQEKDLLELFLTTLSTIANVDKSLLFIKIVFRIKLFHILGFYPEMPKMSEVQKLDNDIRIVFDINDDKILLIDENIRMKNCIDISKETIYAIKYILESDIEKIFDFSISDKILVECSKLSNMLYTKYIE